jgi:hypothetical protein
MHARQGIGTAFMNRIHRVAGMHGIKVWICDVSRTAQPFETNQFTDSASWQAHPVESSLLPTARALKACAILQFFPGVPDA